MNSHHSMCFKINLHGPKTVICTQPAPGSFRLKPAVWNCFHYLLFSLQHFKIEENIQTTSCLPKWHLQIACFVRTAAVIWTHSGFYQIITIKEVVQWNLFHFQLETQLCEDQYIFWLSFLKQWFHCFRSISIESKPNFKPT